MTSRLPAIAATLAVHLLAIGLWQLSQPKPLPPAPDAWSVIVWEQPKAAAKPEDRVRQRRQPVSEAALPVAAAAPSPEPAAPPAALPTPTLDQPKGSLAAQALQAAGKADALAREAQIPLRGAATVSPNEKLAAAIEGFTKKRWQGKMEVAEIADGSGFGGYGDRVYKVKGPLGTYCVRVESNAPHRGNDPFRSEPQRQWVTNC